MSQHTKTGRKFRASTLLGKTITRVEIIRLAAEPKHSRSACIDLQRLVFSDGSTLEFDVTERETDYAIEPIFRSPTKEAGK